MEGTRYDEIAAWYDETFRPSLTPPESEAVARHGEYPYTVALRCRR